MANYKILGEVRFVFAWPHVESRSLKTTYTHFVDMACAVAEAAVESRNIGISQFINGSGVTCEDGGYITMFVTAEKMWTDDNLTSVATELGKRIYAKLGTTIESQRDHERANEYKTRTLVKWCWTRRFPSNAPQHEYVNAA